jgi:multiple sugar transport system ATP-binding protein
VAQVVLENIYKSFAQQPGQAAAPTAPSEQQTSDASSAASSSASSKSARSTVSVLRNINLQIQDGEFMVLVGPSGCGKSTLLRLIAGLETETGGTITVGDRIVNQLPPKERDIAMVFQSYALYPHMSVYENLAFGLRRTGVQASLGDRLFGGLTRSLPTGLRYQSPREKAIAERVQTVAQMLQIEALLQRLPKQLSGGQKQRVALGRAMARNPQVFLMDEPLSNLDAKLRTETRTQIVNLQRKLGTTTIYVTHDQTEAMTMGDRIAVMNGGVIQQIAPPLELYNQPANRFVAEFIGSPPMNFLPVMVTAPLHVQHPQFQLTLPETWDLRSHVGQSLTLGVRPEHLQVMDRAIVSRAIVDRSTIARDTSTIESSLTTLPVVCDRVEALGSETYLTVHLVESETGAVTSAPLQVRTESERLIQVGDALELGFNLSKLHLFEDATGLAVANVLY